VPAGLRLSLGLFTALPVGEVGDAAVDPRRVRTAILLAPVVGLMLGLVAAVILFATRELAIHTQGKESPQHLYEMGLVGALLGAVLSIGFLVAATKGLHIDGLADTADAMAANADRERTLTVMRASDIGPMGVTVIALVLLLEVLCVALATVRGHGTLSLATAAVSGRVALVWCCRYPAARPQGLGAWVAGSVTTLQSLVVTLIAMLIPLAFLWRDDDPRGRVVPFAMLAIPLSIAVVLLCQWVWRRRIGGITGDTLGASVEVGTAVALLFLAIAPA
jgi:adenosylcobinamide-GDP ribazoletransferase